MKYNSVLCLLYESRVIRMTGGWGISSENMKCTLLDHQLFFVPDGNRNMAWTNRNWLDIVERDPQILEIPGWKTLALKSLGGQDCTALENRKSGETGQWEIYINLSLQTNFLKRKSVYTSTNYRCIRKQKVLKPIRFVTSVCLSVRT